MPQTRRTLLTSLTLAACVAATSADGQTVDNRQPTLRERLVTGLQVRRPSEFAFIDAVVDTVDRGEMPERLVDRFLFWARKKAPHARDAHRPIVYFQPALTIQASKLKIAIRPTPPPTA